MVVSKIPNRPKTRSDDSCLVYFTSGTVGYPKWCYMRMQAIPLVTLLRANTGSTCMRMTCTGIFLRWVGQTTRIDIPLFDLPRKIG